MDGGIPSYMSVSGNILVQCHYNATLNTGLEYHTCNVAHLKGLTPFESTVLKYIHYTTLFVFILLYNSHICKTYYEIVQEERDEHINCEK